MLNPNTNEGFFVVRLCIKKSSIHIKKEALDPWVTRLDLSKSWNVFEAYGVDVGHKFYCTWLALYLPVLMRSQFNGQGEVPEVKRLTA